LLRVITDPGVDVNVAPFIVIFDATGISGAALPIFRVVKFALAESELP